MSGGFPGEPLGVGDGTKGQLGGMIGIVENAKRSVGVVVWIPAVDKVSGHPIGNDIGQSPNPARHDREPAGLCFGRDETKGLAPGWHEDDVRGPVEDGQASVVLRRPEPHPIVEAHRGHRLVDPLQFDRPSRTARSTDDHHPGTVMLLDDALEGFHCHVDTLQRLDPPHEQHHRPVGNAEGAARGVL